jgi:hypothetical protein
MIDVDDPIVHYCSISSSIDLVVKLYRAARPSVQYPLKSAANRDIVDSRFVIPTQPPLNCSTPGPVAALKGADESR